MLKVATVIVTYNGSKWLGRCLRQLSESTYPTDIIIVDNHSTDDTLQQISSFNYPVDLIKNPENSGFGKGNNIGIKRAIEHGAECIFLLNQDAYVAPDCIENLVSAIEKHSDYGIISPLQYGPNGIELDHSFKKYAGKLNDKLTTVRFVNAAAWLVPVRVFQQVGYFHPVFQHYGEDNNFASRVMYHGYKIGIISDASVIHDRSQEPGDERKFILRKLRTVPLYILLDIRKPFWLAFLLAYLKMTKLIRKLSPLNENETVLAAQQKEWFQNKISIAKKIRKDTMRKSIEQPNE